MTGLRQKMSWAICAFFLALAGALAVTGGVLVLTSAIPLAAWIALSGIGAAGAGVMGWLMVRPGHFGPAGQI